MTDFNWQQTKQLSILQLLAAVFIPSAGGYALFHSLLPAVVNNGVPVLVAYSIVASAGLSIIVLFAIYILRKEAIDLGISFAARACLLRVSGKQWLVFIGLLVAMFVVIGGAQQLSIWIINSFNIHVPDYMPFFLNPTIEPMTTDMAILSPGLSLRGAYFVLPLITVVITLNILAEELYFRAWILPKLSRYGNWAWVINGILFALYHSFQLWLLPIILVASLTFAYIVYRSKSIYPALVFHFIANLLLGVASISVLIFGS